MTCVALVRHQRTRLIEPASCGQAVIVGSEVELRAALGLLVFDVAPAHEYIAGRWTITVADWLAAGRR